MLIQEMRSGLDHLPSKTSKVEVSAAGLPARVSDDAASELKEARWSVVSFQRREAGGLTYRQAELFMEALDAGGVAGLCIVTDEAAERITDQNSRTTFPKLSLEAR